MKRKQFYSFLLIFAFGYSLVNAQIAHENNSKFSMEMYRQISYDNQNNLFFSPMSISSAMAIPYIGAKGETKREFEEVLFFDTDREQNFASIVTMQQSLVQKNTGKTKLNIANALWVQRDLDIKPEFYKTLRKYDATSLSQADFASSPQVARIMINNWTARKTENQIKDLLKSDDVSPTTTSVVVNAVHFNGKWRTPFDEKSTISAPFYASNGSQVNAKFMVGNQSDYYSYYEDNMVQVVEIPYKGNKMSMLVVLPKNNIADVEKRLMYDVYQTWTSRLRSAKVHITMPKFEMEYEMSANDALQSMGMVNAFTNRANFSDMASGIKLQKVIHKAKIKVNEEGTEAAASTAVISAYKGIDNDPVIEFNANSPFIYFIKDNENQAIVFMGRMMNPSPNATQTMAFDERPIYSPTGRKSPDANNTSTVRPTSLYNPNKKRIIPLDASNSTYTPPTPTPVEVADDNGTTINNNTVATTTSTTKLHEVRSGDNMIKIARQYGISTNQLKDWNGLKSDQIFIGQVLKVVPDEVKALNTSTNTSNAKVHVVQKGETVYSIAKTYNLKLEDIIKFNQIENYEIIEGQELLIGLPAEFDTKGINNSTTTTLFHCPDCKKHTVSKGETIFRIAKNYSTTVSKIMELNKLEDYIIEIGQELIVSN